MPKRVEFIGPRAIIGEGFEDASFVRALIKARNLHGFDVSPTIDIGSTGGNSGFEEACIACEPVTGFAAVKEVVILADNDGDPVASFQQICNQIAKAKQDGNLSRNWGAATQPLVKAAGDPSVNIWMWPHAGLPGCLETLLWQVIQARHPNESACVEDALRCSGANGWSSSKADKARVRCFISLVCKRNPALTLGLLWRDAPNLIPVMDAAFDPVATFLHGI